MNQVSIFSSPVRRTESYCDTPGMSMSVSMSVSVSVSVKMLKFLVQVISFLMFLSTILFFTDYNILLHILLYNYLDQTSLQCFIKILLD